ncbi:hypothetical protein LMG28614_03661 [Paraburkholderia ultramafica]|uniref:Uncharacterized protein n=1 Tax=Paraburkholderia ultramafica TaxID=1544867 RepID=A0A6S7D0Z0_9BURK|nr:hypothetical protein LMG28614_03661 [Paraburkholderia ultramafica]
MVFPHTLGQFETFDILGRIVDNLVVAHVLDPHSAEAYL